MAQIPTCHNIIGLGIGICDRLSNHLTVILRTSPECHSNMYDTNYARNSVDLNQPLCYDAVLCMSAKECNKFEMITRNNLFIYVIIVSTSIKIILLYP